MREEDILPVLKKLHAETKPFVEQEDFLDEDRVRANQDFFTTCYDVLPMLLEELKHLRERDLQLILLENRGVDNWQGYVTLPDREDYDTEEEWNKAVEDVMCDY